MRRLSSKPPDPFSNTSAFRPIDFVAPLRVLALGAVLDRSMVTLMTQVLGDSISPIAFNRLGASNQAYRTPGRIVSRVHLIAPINPIG